ncbi:MAG: leucine-rich repeat domain-containing protein [Saprospiraceae bacterium]
MKLFNLLILFVILGLMACNKDEIQPITDDNDDCNHQPFYEVFDTNSISIQIACKCDDEVIDLTNQLLSYNSVWSIDYDCEAERFNQIPVMPSVTHLNSEVLTANVLNFPNLEVFKNQVHMETPLPYQLRLLLHLKEMTLFNPISFPDIISDIPLEKFKISFERTTSFPNVTIPSNLSQLKNLKELKIKNMGLIILTDYDNLSDLEYLEVENTTLARIPSVTNQWSKLKALELKTVDFRGNLPAIFQDINSLETVYLSDMEVDETIQERLYQAPNLKELTISYCQITPIPDEIGNLTTLENLIITTDQNTLNNPITLPLTIRNLTNLKSIFVSTNTNKFPQALLELKSTLETIAIQDNIGTVPTEIGDFTVLKTLKLTNCGLTSLPLGIQNLSNTLEKIYLSGNNFDDIMKSQIENWLPNTDVYF